jgi:hypothetical protein
MSIAKSSEGVIPDFVSSSELVHVHEFLQSGMQIPLEDVGGG